ncbi:hypothetical protein [Polyangium sp. 6x1]|uniref:hypothetical protein n=1 Tax=Polyangium sp. 6x1 TaxID=3042689 RepID=UPI0024832039|nr:hypothetical protein [Polyangium sp. 6x1]MDI1446024.1 hypothetical protein [Polyangium sp. 6x1]
MKKVLEIIAVIVVVLCLISVGVLLSRAPGSGARAIPGSAVDDAHTATIIGGGP